MCIRDRPLTDRDRELARLVAGRCTNKEIAAALYLSEGTVKQYINPVSYTHLQAAPDGGDSLLVSAVKRLSDRLGITVQQAAHAWVCLLYTSY